MATVLHNGQLVGDRDEINFVDGGDGQAAVTVTDNSSANRVDVSIAATGGGGSGDHISVGIAPNQGFMGFDSSNNPRITGPQPSSFSDLTKGLIIDDRIKSVHGMQTTSQTGLFISRQNGGAVYTENNTIAGGQLLLSPTQNNNDVIWHRISIYGVVLAHALTGTLDVIVEYHDRFSVVDITVIEGFDITVNGHNSNQNSSEYPLYLCVPIVDRGNGIFWKIVSNGVTGTGINVTFDTAIESDG